MSDRINTSEHQAWVDIDSVKPTAGYDFGTDATNKDIAKNFGLKFESDKNNQASEIKIGPFVGVQRLSVTDGTDVIAHSSPKQFDNKTMDYAAMFDYCMGNPTVARHMGKCFFVWTDESQIPIEKDKQIYELLIFSFVNSLHELCQRHLRRTAIRRTENLVGKVKGRIMVSQQIRQNLSVNRPDRVVCNYIEHNIDCRENQILRAALEVAAKYISAKGYDNLNQKIGFCRNALEGVSVRRIDRREFIGIRYAGAFQHYKEAHGLAKAVLFTLGINPEDHSQAQKEMTQVYPFVLCTFELFERFTEAVLRRQYKDHQLWVGYDNNDLTSDGYTVRPDMILIDNDGTPYIIDAKYKVVPNGKACDEDRKDAYKSVAYAHHFGVIKLIESYLAKLGHDENLCKNRKTVLLYPQLVKTEKQNHSITFTGYIDVGFSRLIKVTIPCPMQKL
ncbi:MAG: hypothetical protein QM523_04800 [Candidatus Pacebacteria bacterium]|nr:hypothetical protein [Candidatus Paceibacterota bacterium]